MNNFQIQNLKNNRIRIVPPTTECCEYKYMGGKINTKTLHSLISNGYSKKPKTVSNIDGYEMDKSLSGTRAQVYHNPTTNHLVVNHRGTKGIHDVVTDIRLMFGDKSNKRFQHGKKITDEALKKYDTDNVTICGHSLGSQIASEANKKHNKETIVVNPAMIPSEITKKQKDNETVIRSKLDPISYLHSLNPFASKSRTITIKSKSMNPLTEHSSDVLNRLDPNMDVGV